jgi:hypothetical protein
VANFGRPHGGLARRALEAAWPRPLPRKNPRPEAAQAAGVGPSGAPGIEGAAPSHAADSGGYPALALWEDGAPPSRPSPALWPPFKAQAAA